MKNIRLAIFLAIKDMLNNVGSLLFVAAALGFLFANVLFSRFMLYGFEVCIGKLVPKVSGQVYYSPIPGDSYIYKSDELLDKIYSSEIAAVTPVLEMPCVLDYNNARIVTMVWGVEFKDDVMEANKHIIEGNYFNNPYAEEIIIGKILKRRFEQKFPQGEKIRIGDVIQAIFLKENNIDEFNKEVYRDKYCKVAGVADFKDYMANNAILMPINALRQSVILPERTSYLFIRLKDDKDIAKSKVGYFTPPRTDIRIKHWKDRDDYGTDDLVYGFNLISMVIFVVSIICAAILVAFVVFYNTQKKRRTTGILRAIGLRDRVFFILFLLQGIFFSIIGLVSGTALYYLLELYMRRYPVAMPFGDLYPIFETRSYIWATTLFVAVSFIASLYYAAKTSKENIIKIIRGD